MLKGGEKEAGKLLLSVVKSSIEFNLIKDVIVKNKESIMGVMQWLALLCIYLNFLCIYLNFQLIGNYILLEAHY